MTKLVLKSIPFADYGDPVYAALLWQDLNKHVLALCPPRWASLDSYQKWCLLRILAQRDGYVPDWVSLDIWLSLKRQLIFVAFDDETTLLCLGGAGAETSIPPDAELLASIARLDELREADDLADEEYVYLEDAGASERACLVEEEYPMAYEEYPEYPEELDFSDRGLQPFREIS